MKDQINQDLDTEFQFTAYKKLKCIEGYNIFNKYTIKGYLGNNSNRLYLGQDCFGKLIAIKENHNITCMRKEVSILESLNHPNIIQYLDSCILQLSNNKYHQEYLGYICMELGKCDLDSYILNNKYQGTELIEQTLSAFAYLQSQQIAHCDIKPANIIISQIDPILFKICDVGSSKHQDSVILSAIGTFNYMSPEMWNGEATNYYLSDVYSLGLLFLQVYKGYQLKCEERRQLTEEQQIKKIHSLLNDNDDISQLLNKMLQLNPSDRMDFIQLEKFWLKLKILRERQIYNFTQSRCNRVQSNYASILEDIPLKNSYFTTTKILSKQIGNKYNSKKDLLNQFHSISPTKQINLVEKRGLSTSYKQRAPKLFPIDIQSQKTSISPKKSKTNSPKKMQTQSKFQLPQIKDKEFKLNIFAS